MTLGALSKNTKKYVHSYIASKNEDYICVECNEDLILCKGNVVKPYFRHKVDTTCKYYNNPGESQIHKDSKMLLKYILENNILSINRYCSVCKEKNTYIIDVKSSDIKLEYRFIHNNKLKVADVVCIENDEIKYIFEIHNTHRTEECDRPDPWFELNAIDIIKCIESSNYNISCIRETKNGCDCETYKCSRCNDESPKFISVANRHHDFCKGCDIQYFNCIYLSVPYKQKEDAKKLGARWDNLMKKWYCDVSNKDKFTQWLK